MTTGINILKGIVHGKTIELEQDAGLPDGQPVAVTLSPAPHANGSLRRAFGAWAQDADELDSFLDRLLQDRHQHRSDSAA